MAIRVMYTKYPHVWYKPNKIIKIISVCVIRLIPNLVNFDMLISSTCGAVDPGAPLTLARRFYNCHQNEIKDLKQFTGSYPSKKQMRAV